MYEVLERVYIQSLSFHVLHPPPKKTSAMIQNDQSARVQGFAVYDERKKACIFAKRDDDTMIDLLLLLMYKRTISPSLGVSGAPRRL